MDNIPAAFYRFEIAVDGTHQLKYASERLFELFEIPHITVLTDVAILFDRIVIEDRPGFDRVLDAKKVEQSWQWEGRWIFPSGSIKWIRAESRHIVNFDGSSVWDGILIDISDRKQVEAQLHRTNQELLQATRQKDEFIAKIGHEIRTPLTAILGMSEILKEGILGTLNQQQLESLLTIDRNGAQLLSLINDILDLSKIAQSTLELNIAPVSVLSACTSSLAFVKQQALDKQIQLDLQVPPGVGNIAVDERRLHQILVELLNNGIKFTPSGGNILLKVTRQDDDEDRGWIDFAITDTGIGIESAALDRLFQPFIQIDSKLNRQYVGAGLGLFLAQQLVGLHGGRIFLHSELGVGSCFTVHLPSQCLITAHNQGFVPFDRQIGIDMSDKFFN